MKYFIIILGIVAFPVLANEQSSSSMFQFLIDIAARVDDFLSILRDSLSEYILTIYSMPLN
ncbi:hypothetical protein ACQKPX_24155 [Photobacterium sp. DNB23_23_1]